MSQLELSPAAEHWVAVVLIWVGFGALAGLVARMVFPVRRPVGPVQTMLVGIAGSALGLFVLSLFVADRPLNPIGPLGFLAATIGALLLLIVSHLCLAYWHRRT
jgi:uncharacterized membrane protein YeaQ/YmgE (transglycosylase-associated protein family)